MIIIPAIDIMGGKCVRLTKGDYEKVTLYDNDPVGVAKSFEDAGIKRLHLVDLDGARAGEVRNWKVLENIAGKTGLVIDFSGGLSNRKNLSITFDSGAAFAAVGSIAVNDEALFSEWIKEFGPARFIIGADVRNERIVIRGWTEQTEITVYDLIGKYLEKGVQAFFCTDVNKDGLLEGPSVELYKKILETYPSIHLIASGGIHSLKDLDELEGAGCSGAIIGKALYEKRILLSDLQPYLI